MQRCWREDHDKLTFIICLPLDDQQLEILPGASDSPNRMVGDVNLFLSPADEDPEGYIGELELMIAPSSKRRQGLGRSAILVFLNYIQKHFVDILAEYRQTEYLDRMSLLQMRVKIGSKNEKSIKLFESIGFVKVQEGANYFGEFELMLEGLLDEERTNGLLKKYKIEGYQELPYVESRE